jgi:site-specific recombinase XerD
MEANELVISGIQNEVNMHTSRVLDYFIGQQSEGTARTYSATLRGFFDWFGKDFRLVTPFDALDYDAHLKTTCADITRQTKVSTITKFFSFAKECHLIEANPFKVVKQHAAPNRSAERFLTPAELGNLLETLRKKGQKEYTFGLLLAATGMRISEAQMLDWCDFMEAPDGSMLINLLRKGNERQLLPLREDVWQVVKDFMGREINQQDHTPLFRNRADGRLSDVSLRKIIKRAAKEAGISKEVTPHMLRHTFATISLDRGADIRDVSWYLNHKSIATTQIYAHPTNLRVGEFMPL